MLARFGMVRGPAPFGGESSVWLSYLDGIFEQFFHDGEEVTERADGAAGLGDRAMALALA